MNMDQCDQYEEGEISEKDILYCERVTLEQLKSKDLYEQYEILHEVGSGTYGRVYKAYKKEIKDKYFALKQLDVSKEKDGFPITALREIKLLQKLNHQNILKINEIVTMKTACMKDKRQQKVTTFLVFDYMEHDLQGLIKKHKQFTTQQIKCLMKQLFSGLQYLHSQNTIHRDLKSANLLLNKEGILKIGDFGLARQVEKPLLRPLTSVVVTLWYRAPEILFGDRNYSFKSDVWSAGCFMAELLLSEPLFNGKTESNQIEQIYDKCGAPDPEQWIGLTQCKNWKELQAKKEYEPQLTSYMRSKIPDIDSATLDYLSALLVINPEDRLDSKQALEHEYFTTQPLPCTHDQMPVFDKEFHYQPERNLNFYKIKNVQKLKLLKYKQYGL
ncbi:hypothetical protein IMG5_003410 [Ichthyophthirius multifiliis]|uniref:Cyclin-dependent kinase 2 homolog n=1 Tax=Ichthyophthirius multifiliis TaxID=5932 RepID=G0QJ99_ICHMU|nr:hypothetical protein IMG5_003410 [Ichthyophthirius multifiliis]EGR34708.1 hypothetical protein IMG5_003410 [Ichthyophthirius multifiliis]|eukprot:XP_004040012.1 hypothetical protein IMG5_003410 [Ichthyophthirius multifiliis]